MPFKKKYDMVRSYIFYNFIVTDFFLLLTTFYDLMNVNLTIHYIENMNCTTVKGN